MEYLNRLNRALRFIETSYAENIKLEDIAEKAHISLYHFHRIFTSIIGETPGEYLRRARLEKAALTLIHRKDISVTQIAFDTGFSSSSVFSRAFIKRFGLSPREYRAQNKIIKIQADQHQINNKAFDRHEGSIDNETYHFKSIIQLPKTRLAFVRSMHGYGPNIKTAWKSLMAWAYPKGLITEKTGRYGIPLDNPDITPSNKCRYFVAISINDTVIPDGPAELLVVDKGWYAEFLFYGTKEKTSSFYQYVYGYWFPQNGYIPDDRPNLERYSDYNTRIKKDNSTPSQRIFHFSLMVPLAKR